MAFFILFPTAAWTGIIPSHFFLRAVNRFWCGGRITSAVQRELWSPRLFRKGLGFFASNELELKETFQRIGLNARHHARKHVIALRVYTPLTGPSDHTLEVQSRPVNWSIPNK